MRHLLNMFEIFSKFNAKFCAVKGANTYTDEYICTYFTGVFIWKSLDAAQKKFDLIYLFILFECQLKAWQLILRVICLWNSVYLFCLCHWIRKSHNQVLSNAKLSDSRNLIQHIKCLKTAIRMHTRVVCFLVACKRYDLLLYNFRWYLLS